MVSQLIEKRCLFCQMGLNRREGVSLHFIVQGDKVSCISLLVMLMVEVFDPFTHEWVGLVIGYS